MFIFILLLLRTSRGQSNLSSVILENAMLNAQDGLRFLYIFGYRCGNQIEYLNMAYFFKYGIHPIKGEDNGKYLKLKVHYSILKSIELISFTICFLFCCN